MGRGRRKGSRNKGYYRSGGGRSAKEGSRYMPLTNDHRDCPKTPPLQHDFNPDSCNVRSAPKRGEACRMPVIHH
jgi:hypothetical protein